MHFKAFRPSPVLEPYIRSYYYFNSGVKKDGTETVARYPSDGGPQLVVNLGDTFLAGSRTDNLKHFTGCRLLGTLTRQLITKSGGGAAFLAIRFRPGKLGLFSGVRSSELTNTSANLESLLGPFGKGIEQRLFNFDTIEQMLQYFESCLLSRLQPEPLFDTKISAAVDLIEQSNGQLRVGNLADHLGLSLRQFERRFTNWVGLKPKRYCRICRFNNILKSFDQAHGQSWVTRAMDSGYSDHAHFIRECKFFTGASPESYLTLRSPLEVAVWSKNRSAHPVDGIGNGVQNRIKNPLI